MRYLLLLSYDGTDFSGWQRQPKGRTVQETVETCAAQIFARPTPVTASGRTDAGVHAFGQVAQLDAATSIPPEKLAACFNRLLPADIKVRKSALAPEGFDVTRSARRKTYAYTAYYAKTILPLLSRYATYLKQRPLLEPMQRASKLLVGRHDFCAFRAAGFSAKTSEREIYDIEVDRKVGDGYEKFTVTVTGNGFLYNMVRILCGELFAVGMGKEEGFSRAFQTGERKCLARTMPPEGLCLLKVDFDVPIFGADEPFQ